MGSMTHRRKFRWTRKLYYQAHRESRIYWGYGFMHHDEPPLVKRLQELWEQHPQNEDPLLRPFRWRHDYCPDGIPF